ncbi:hypothetical protein ACFL27_05205 [candidate division CSSED10-310 bacterium]|uniref:Uncharacterized protein n=1 Tax=candidate division CSSED10-310 bacterium TaxID=2855610 RepID=A0ABV6YTT5_UNCC1
MIQDRDFPLFLKNKMNEVATPWSTLLYATGASYDQLSHQCQLHETLMAKG